MPHSKSSFRALTLGAFVLGLSSCGGGQDSPAAADVPAPSLLVLVSVDQLRGDLLERYDTLFTRGVRRLHDEGYRFTNGTHDHAGTTTAAGHASLGLGVHPRTHGIVGNEWWVETDAGVEELYAVADPDSPLLNHPGEEGRSPANMLRDGLADWILAAEPRARVVSISRKDRAAIPMAGRARGHVYWIVPETGEFTTSTYYAAELPAWVTDFNATAMRGLYQDTVWTSTVPEAAKVLTRGDTASYERYHPLTYFPHHGRAEIGERAPDELAPRLNEWVTETPVSDRAGVALAMRAMDELALGRQGHVDFLALSLSATDHVGHNYGPSSREQLDNLLRLDEQLGLLMDHLDATVGAGGWAMAFSADHGVADEPEHRQEQGMAGYRVTQSDRDRIGAMAMAVAAGGGGPDEVAGAVLADSLVAQVLTYASLEGTLPEDTLAALSYRSHVPGRHRSPLGRLGVVVNLREFDMNREYMNGSGHGSTYHYDRWVPIILLGPGVQPGFSPTAVATVDVAPTLAAWARVPTPGDLDGRDIRPR